MRSKLVESFNPRGPDAAERLAAMDEMGIDVQCLTTATATHYWAQRDLARQIAQVQNEKLAELCAAHPGRFVGLATVSLQFPDLAAEQLEDAIRKYDMRGVMIGGSVNGAELATKKSREESLEKTNRCRDGYPCLRCFRASRMGLAGRSEPLCRRSAGSCIYSVTSWRSRL